jgi:uncharacterized protein YggE
MHRWTRVIAAALFAAAIVFAARAIAGAFLRGSSRLHDTVEVKGSAAETLKAGSASLRVIVSGEAARRGAAGADAEAARAAVLRVLDGAEVTPASIAVGDVEDEEPDVLDLEPHHVGRSARGAAPATGEGRRVSRTITVSRIAPDAADAVARQVAELKSRGLGVAIDGPYYQFPDRPEAERRVREAAARDAREQAGRIVRAAGGTVAALRSLELQSPRMSPLDADEDGEGGRCGPVQALRATVSATYEIGP